MKRYNTPLMWVLSVLISAIFFIFGCSDDSSTADATIVPADAVGEMALDLAADAAPDAAGDAAGDSAGDLTGDLAEDLADDGAAPQEVELKYDDGTPEGMNSPWDDGVGSQYGVGFTPPSYPAKIIKASFYVSMVGQPTTPFGVRVYQGGGSNGGPGADLLGTPVVAAATGGEQWVEVDLSNENIVVSSGDFFIAMEWLTDPGPQGMNAQFLADDINQPDSRSWWMSGATDNWQTIDTVGVLGDRDLLLRATVTH
jgi:hypothetical protein